MIRSYVRFCMSGFGLGVNAARAFGIAVLIVTFIFVAAFYAISWIVKFFLNRKKAKEQQQQA